MKNIYKDIIDMKKKIAVVGLGYVGMPLAISFAKKVKTIGYDIDKKKINRYLNGVDVTKEVGDEKIKKSTILFTSEESKLRDANFFIIAVPTPINSDKTPNLNLVKNASEIIGRNLTRGSIIVYESTVFPGVTEDICVPIIEDISGLKCGIDFKVGYSPERINPGDKVNRLENIVKIVSGIDEETAEIIGKVYEIIIEAGVYKTSSIKVAEAAKLVENAQRDINIAFMNELAIFFEKMDISTNEVINAMNTKWNALGFKPGLVGGHCIGVDPYYFIYKAEKLGYNPQIILEARKINEEMGNFIADISIKNMVKSKTCINKANVYILGITFKENCTDIRNSKVLDIVNRFKEYDVDVKIVDPIANVEDVKEVYDIDLVDLSLIEDADCLIFAVGHYEFKRLSIEQIKNMYRKDHNIKNILIDVKSIFSKEKMEKEFIYWSL